jgi:hypothetical protein
MLRVVAWWRSEEIGVVVAWDLNVAVAVSATLETFFTPKCRREKEEGRKGKEMYNRT